MCSRQYYEKKFWSATFILLSLSIGFLLILQWLKKLLNDHHPIPYLFFYSFSTTGRVSEGAWQGG